MANTFTQISIHVVFAVKGRKNLLNDYWRDELFKYIHGILKKEVKPLAVGGWKDHVHIFFGLPPTISISEIVKKVKENSSRWINQNDFVLGKFRWQEGYSAFSYSKSQRDSVIKYIMNQEKHHKKKSFKEEYLEILDKFDIKYDEKYIFEFYE